MFAVKGIAIIHLVSIFVFKYCQFILNVFKFCFNKKKISRHNNGALAAPRIPNRPQIPTRPY